MKFEAMMRITFIVAGVAALLWVPNSARAQQDVDPTLFDVSPAAPQADESPVVRTAANVAPEAPAVQPAAAASADAAQVTPVDNIILVGAMICAGLIALRGIASSKQRTLRSAP